MATLDTTACINTYRLGELMLSIILCPKPPPSAGAVRFDYRAVHVFTCSPLILLTNLLHTQTHWSPYSGKYIHNSFSLAAN